MDEDSIEKEAFWLRHKELQKSSGLPRTEYCRQNNISYDNFGYWVKKWRHANRNATGLVSIRLKTTEDSAELPTLCTLGLKNGHFIQIHDLTALEIIFEKVR